MHGKMGLYLQDSVVRRLWLSSWPCSLLYLSLSFREMWLSTAPWRDMDVRWPLTDSQGGTESSDSHSSELGSNLLPAVTLQPEMTV